MDWLLRIGVALQCVGHAWLVGVVAESPLLGWLWEPTDVGGLGLGEGPALAIARVVGGLLAVAAIGTLLGPSRWLLCGVVLFQFVLALAAWQTHAGFPLDVAWLGAGKARAVGEALAPLLPFAASAARIALPIVLLLVHWSHYRKLLGVAVTPAAERVARVGLALTFAAHGLEALSRRGSFLDMLITAADKLFGQRLPETVAQMVLMGIGVADLVVAGLVLTTRLRGVAWYMAAWGFITAAARFVVLSPQVAWYEFALRSAHWVLPLFLVLAWRVVPAASAMLESSRRAETKSI